MRERRMPLVVGCLSAVLTAFVWVASLPRFGVVTNVLGYTPAWMFALLLASIVAGVIASVYRKIWWVAVAAAAFSTVLMLVKNNS